MIAAIADARIVEEKTSNPDNYEKLDVDDPQQDGRGTKVFLSGNTSAGQGFSYIVILGKNPQSSQRYVRIDGRATSYLIDRNPDPGSDTNDWLLRDILNIPASVRAPSAH